MKNSRGQKNGSARGIRDEASLRHMGGLNYKRNRESVLIQCERISFRVYTAYLNIDYNLRLIAYGITSDSPVF